MDTRSFQAEGEFAHYRSPGVDRVWVDTARGLYYCPSDRLYGRAKPGYFSSESEAKVTGKQSTRTQPCFAAGAGPRLDAEAAH